jgi:hypothetical protein
MHIVVRLRRVFTVTDAVKLPAAARTAYTRANPDTGPQDAGAAVSRRAPGRLRQSACHPMGASQRSRLTMRVVAVWPESARVIRRYGRQPSWRDGRRAPRRTG